MGFFGSLGSAFAAPFKLGNKVAGSIPGVQSMSQHIPGMHNMFGGGQQSPPTGIGPSNPPSPPTPPSQSNEGSAQPGEAPQFGTAPNSGTSTDMSTAQPMQQMAGAMNQQPSQAQQFMGNQNGQGGGFGNYMLGPQGFGGLQHKGFMLQAMQPQIMQMLNNMAPGFGNKAGQQMQQMMPQIQQGMNMNRGFGGGMNRGIGPRWGQRPMMQQQQQAPQQSIPQQQNPQQ